MLSTPMNPRHNTPPQLSNTQHQSGQQPGHAKARTPEVIQTKRVAPTRFWPQQSQHLGPMPPSVVTKKAGSNDPRTVSGLSSQSGAPVLQMKNGKTKGAREQKKMLRKKMHQKVQHAKASPDRMQATAIRGNDSVSSESGTNTADTRDIENYILTAGINWPWSNKPRPILTRQHRNCAEAHVYAILISRSENPKSYHLISYNKEGKVAPPCDNCKTWVGGAFKSVERLNATYRPSSTRSPNR